MKNKNLLKILSILFVITLLFSVSAGALDMRADEYDFSYWVPDGWTILYHDDVSTRGDYINDGGYSIGNDVQFDTENTYIDLISEDGNSELQITIVQNDFSEDAVQLSRIDREYKNSIIKGLQSGDNFESFEYTYAKSTYYETEQAEFIRYEMSWNPSDREIPMLKYYTIVNGYNISVNYFSWDGERSEDEDSMVQEVVDSMKWDELLEATEEFNGYTAVSMGSFIKVLLGLILICGGIFAIYCYEDWRPYVVNFVRKIFKKNNKN